MLRSTRLFVLVPATLAAFTAACFNPGHQQLTITDENGHVVHVTIDGEDVPPVASERPTQVSTNDDRSETAPPAAPVVQPEPTRDDTQLGAVVDAPVPPAYPDPSWAVGSEPPAPPAYPDPSWAPAPVDNIAAGDRPGPERPSVPGASPSPVSAFEASAPAPVQWIHWTSTAGTRVDGDFSPAASFVRASLDSASGYSFVQLNNAGTNFFSPSAPYESTGVAAPSTSDMVAFNLHGERVLRLSQPVDGLYMALVSLNGNVLSFDHDFDIVSQTGSPAVGGPSTCGYYGCGQFQKRVVRTPDGAVHYELDAVSGEPHGVIRFNGRLDSLVWSQSVDENWSGMTLGIPGERAAAPAPAPAPVPAPASELIVNGDFENPALSYGSWSQFPSIQGWKLSFGHSIEVQNHAAGSPVQGDQFVELDSDGSSGIYQDVATVAGARYELNFRYSPRPGVEESNNAIEVWIDGDRLATVSSNGRDIRDTSWARIVLPVRASGRQMRVEFRDAGTSDSYGGYIDAVSVKLAH